MNEFKKILRPIMQLKRERALKKEFNVRQLIEVAILFICFLLAVIGCANAATASWYSVESCLKESGQYTMANGRKLNDAKFTAASWDYAFGTKLKVTNLANGKSVIVEITDRGPAKRLYNKGRVLDLSKGAFQAIAQDREGIISITYKEVK